MKDGFVCVSNSNGLLEYFSNTNFVDSPAISSSRVTDTESSATKVEIEIHTDSNMLSSSNTDDYVAVAVAVANAEIKTNSGSLEETPVELNSNSNDTSGNMIANRQRPDDSEISFDDLRDTLLRQIEFYLSRENLSSDSFLVSKMDTDNFVEIEVLAKFNMVRKLTSDLELVTDILKSDPRFEISKDDKKVRPIYLKRGTVILREVSDQVPIEDVQELFSDQNCPQFISCEYVYNNTWYITFDTDEEAHSAYRHLREVVKVFKGRPIMARMKPKPNMSQTKNGYRAPAASSNRNHVPRPPPVLQVPLQPNANRLHPVNPNLNLNGANPGNFQQSTNSSVVPNVNAAPIVHNASIVQQVPAQVFDSGQQRFIYTNNSVTHQNHGTASMPMQVYNCYPGLMQWTVPGAAPGLVDVTGMFAYNGLAPHNSYAQNNLVNEPNSLPPVNSNATPIASSTSANNNSSVRTSFINSNSNIIGNTGVMVNGAGIQRGGKGARVLPQNSYVSVTSGYPANSYHRTNSPSYSDNNQDYNNYHQNRPGRYSASSSTIRRRKNFDDNNNSFANNNNNGHHNIYNSYNHNQNSSYNNTNNGGSGGSGGNFYTNNRQSSANQNYHSNNSYQNKVSITKESTFDIERAKFPPLRASGDRDRDHFRNSANDELQTTNSNNGAISSSYSNPTISSARDVVHVVNDHRLVDIVKSGGGGGGVSCSNVGGSGNGNGSGLNGKLKSKESVTSIETKPLSSSVNVNAATTTITPISTIVTGTKNTSTLMDVGTTKAADDVVAVTVAVAVTGSEKVIKSADNCDNTAKTTSASATGSFPSVMKSNASKFIVKGNGIIDHNGEKNLMIDTKDAATWTDCKTESDRVNSIPEVAKTEFFSEKLLERKETKQKSNVKDILNTSANTKNASTMTVNVNQTFQKITNPAAVNVTSSRAVKHRNSVVNKHSINSNKHVDISNKLSDVTTVKTTTASTAPKASTTTTAATTTTTRAIPTVSINDANNNDQIYANYETVSKKKPAKMSYAQVAQNNLNAKENTDQVNVADNCNGDGNGNGSRNGNGNGNGNGNCNDFSVSSSGKSSNNSSVKGSKENNLNIASSNGPANSTTLSANRNCQKSLNENSNFNGNRTQQQNQRQAIKSSSSSNNKGNNDLGNQEVNSGRQSKRRPSSQYNHSKTKA